MKWKAAQKRARSWLTARTISGQVLAWTARSYRRLAVSSTWEQPCARMAPAQQKSASELPQQWQQWPDKSGSGGAAASTLQASSSSASLFSLQPTSTAVKQGPFVLTDKKDPGLRKQTDGGTSPHLLLGALDQWLGAEQGQPPLDHRNHFWQLSREGNLHGLIMSCTMTASPRPFFKIKTFLIICSCFLLFS